MIIEGYANEKSIFLRPIEIPMHQSRLWLEFMMNSTICLECKSPWPHLIFGPSEVHVKATTFGFAPSKIHATGGTT